ncbi:hypothetical protein D3Z38_11685 [Clostridiales bacterium]|nr:hypothetical protein [Clostridiales bacterium]
MTNAEFHKEEIKNYKGKDICEDFVCPKILKKKECTNINCGKCKMLQIIWLLEEHKEPEVDWSTVPIDTPILGRNNEREEWTRGHFAKLEDGKIGVWTYGGTSFTSTPDCIHYWTHAKLWEGSEEQKEERKQEEAQ